MVLGSRTVEILATHVLIIHGQKASWCAKVSSQRAAAYGGLLNYVDTLLTLVAHFVGPSTTTPVDAMPTSARVIAVCRKCGTMNNFGKRSCCARNATWFKKCGDAGDSNFDHTWAEGVAACKREL